MSNISDRLDLLNKLMKDEVIDIALEQKWVYLRRELKDLFPYIYSPIFFKSNVNTNISTTNGEIFKLTINLNDFEVLIDPTLECLESIVNKDLEKEYGLPLHNYIQKSIGGTTFSVDPKFITTFEKDIERILFGIRRFPNIPNYFLVMGDTTHEDFCKEYYEDLGISLPNIGPYFFDKLNRYARLVNMEFQYSDILIHFKF